MSVLTSLLYSPISLICHSSDIPILPRQIHTLHNLPLAQHPRPPHRILPAHLPRLGLVHRYLPLVIKNPNPIPTNPNSLVAYSLGIYLLNLFLAFLQPKFDPSLTQDEGLEDGSSVNSPLPTKNDEEFRPFIRRLPEFKFWHSATRAVAISCVCTAFRVFDVPVFWPVLVIYWIILFTLTSES